MSKSKLFAIHILPFVLMMIPIHLAWRHPTLLLILYSALLSGYILHEKDRKLEFQIAVVGITWGLILEIIGVRSGFHTFSAPDFMGIPLWLTVIWGCGFILGKRINLIMLTGSPWLK